MRTISEKQKSWSSTIVEFLKKNKYISVNAIETENNIPVGTISRALNGKAYIPEKYIYPLLCTLAPYGFKWMGYSFSFDKETHTLIGCRIGELEKVVEVFHFPDGSEKEVEVRDGKDVYLQGATSSSFYYLHKVDKVMFSDFDDLF